MPRCVSFVHSRRQTFAWSRCARRGDIFCQQHRDDVDGAVMGALHTNEFFHASKAEVEEASLEARSAKIALESALALLTVPPGIPKGRRREKRKGSGGAVDSLPAPLPPQASADG